MTIPVLRRLIVLLMALAVVMTACGDGDTNQPSTDRQSASEGKPSARP